MYSTFFFQVLNVVRLTLSSQKVNLVSIDNPNPTKYTENHPIPVDRTLTDFTVSVAGLRPTVNVYNPRGFHSNNVTQLLDLANVKIVSVKVSYLWRNFPLDNRITRDFLDLLETSFIKRTIHDRSLQLISNILIVLQLLLENIGDPQYILPLWLDFGCFLVSLAFQR